MKYTIIVLEWDSNKLTYELLHYTHSSEDAEKWFKHYSENYENVKMMIDVKQVNNHFARQEFAEFVERMKQKEITR